MTKDLLTDLKKVPDFKSVPEDQLQWLIDKSEIRSYPNGTKVWGVGDEVDGMSIVLTGGLTIYMVQNGNRRDLGTYEPLEILGRLPYSRMKAANGEAYATGELEMLFLHRDKFKELVSVCHDITEALVHNMTDRVRDFTKYQQQNDKMMALGKLSAGLAHELNNPSAAIVRSAQELKIALAAAPHKVKRVLKIQTNDGVVDKLNKIIFNKIQNKGDGKMSLSEKMEREDELRAWMEENLSDVDNDAPEVFADFNFTDADFSEIKSCLRAEDVAPVLEWFQQVLTTEALVNNIEEASKRINTLVSSVKGYTHMDQAPEKHKVDIHTGIRNTITMLNHKLKKAGIKVVENFRHDPPEACILVSEMNQVWTNIIDNAIDAMDGRPNSVLEIKTERDREFSVVSITDNGPGIPKEIKDKIFDAFFTTKPIGKGTGLGLDVVRNIVAQHNGKVEVESEPGKTTFKVCFPTK
ncbi:MAG TPA: ATP-binding protein [Cyclobacteriaceae bacterium]|nr:ATP-binding protein [Cyclobacteriaceae bacterium]